MPDRPRIMSAALRYADMGMPVLPIRPGEKAPLIRGGAHAASTDPSQIEVWWQEWPKADLALACGGASGFDALDVDRQHGGIERLLQFVGAHGSLPETAAQTTPSGGYHLLFRHRPGLKNWSGGQGTAPRGLDCRTDGAMIRTAPTEGYRWTRFIKLDELPPWPACLATFFEKLEGPVRTGAPPRPLASDGDRGQRYFVRALEGMAGDVASARPGCQQATLNAVAFRAGRLLAALPAESVEATTQQLVGAGLAMVNQLGRSPWRRHEVERIVRRAIGDGQAEGPAPRPSDMLENAL